MLADLCIILFSCCSSCGKFPHATSMARSSHNALDSVDGVLGDFTVQVIHMNSNNRCFISGRDPKWRRSSVYPQTCSPHMSIQHSFQLVL
jgi:hypothetical protein